MLCTTGKITSALVLAVTLVGLLWAGSKEAAESEEMQMRGSLANTSVIAQADKYLGAFLSESQMSQYSRVGRLAVQLIRNGGTQEVPFDWVFHTNDEFRFKIATSRDGWLYILHRSPGGQLQLLYPPIANAGQTSRNSRVEKNTSYLVPAPTEGSFVFEKDTGAETFFLVIKDRPEPPALSDIMVSDERDLSQRQNAPGPQEQPQYRVPEAAPYPQYPSQQQGAPGPQEQSQYRVPEEKSHSQYPSQQQSVSEPQVRQQLQARVFDAVNYSIIPRGTKKMTALTYRGVSFKPASKNTDPGTYFAPQPDSELQDAWFVFRLNHVD